MLAVRAVFGFLATLALIGCSVVTAAPVPPGAAPPGPRAPTAAEIAEARKAYEALGGRYLFSETAYGEQSYRQFTLDRYAGPGAFAKLPDLPFEYWLEINLGPDLPADSLTKLGHLKNLRRLTVEFPRDPSSKPVGNLAPLLTGLSAIPNLEHLSLGYLFEGDFLSDELAEKLPEFKALRTLLGTGSITDAGLEKLARHPTLEALTLYRCDKVTDAGLAHLAKMKTLRTLRLWECPKVTAAGLKPFTEDPRLKGLQFGGLATPESALAEIEKIWTLEELNVINFRDGTITERGLRHIGRLPRLRKLYLPGMKLTDEAMTALSNAGALEYLFCCDCSDLTDTGLKALTRIGCLKTLHLSRAGNVTDAGLKELAKLPRLEILRMRDAKKITDAGVKALLRAETLTGLHLDGSAATEQGLRALVADRGLRLRELEVTGVTLSDEFIAYLAFEAPNLTRLNLYLCKGVTDKSVPPLSNLTKLRFLNLHASSVTKDGLRRLREQLFECRVDG